MEPQCSDCLFTSSLKVIFSGISASGKKDINIGKCLKICYIIKVDAVKNITNKLHGHICYVISILYLQAARIVLNMKCIVKIDSNEVNWSLDEVWFPSSEERKPRANILFHDGGIFSKKEGIQIPVTANQRNLGRWMFVEISMDISILHDTVSPILMILYDDSNTITTLLTTL